MRAGTFDTEFLADVSEQLIDCFPAEMRSQTATAWKDVIVRFGFLFIFVDPCLSPFIELLC